MKDNRAIEDFKEALNILLTCGPPLNRHTIYSLIYKLSDDITGRQKAIYSSPYIGERPDMPRTHWTHQALKQYENNLNMKAKPFLFLHLEHPIPRSGVLDWLIDSITPNVNVRIDRALVLLSTTCWVTGRGRTPNLNPKAAQSEQAILDGPKELLWRPKCDMPPNWGVETGDIWARYDAVKKLNGDLGDEFLKVVR